ncbi:hypothetical protein FHL15_008680 [Xylaria flabelliformis]|uniref:Uncharacterized protein n=1 Tax=Xylaria flabelliformis TaxID=2512241 RepID=A0A553HRD9_9PEZI|nr:hypothetical protein FHL15_008680 [Xylaria flabelliformis]
MATGKSNKWDGNAHEALAACLARLHGTVTPEQQEALVKGMQNCGFDFTWEGIRCTSQAILTHCLHFNRNLVPVNIHHLTNTTTMAPPTTPAKPVKKWDDTMVAHLFVCIYNTVDISFTPENKTAIETMMNKEFNHSVGWNGIR